MFNLTKQIFLESFIFESLSDEDSKIITDIENIYHNLSNQKKELTVDISEIYAELKKIHHNLSANDYEVILDKLKKTKFINIVDEKIIRKSLRFLKKYDVKAIANKNRKKDIIELSEKIISIFSAAKKEKMSSKIHEKIDFTKPELDYALTSRDALIQRFENYYIEKVKKEENLDKAKILSELEKIVHAITGQGIEFWLWLEEVAEISSINRHDISFFINFSDNFYKRGGLNFFLSKRSLDASYMHKYGIVKHDTQSTVSSHDYLDKFKKILSKLVYERESISMDDFYKGVKENLKIDISVEKFLEILGELRKQGVLKFVKFNTSPSEIHKYKIVINPFGKNYRSDMNTYAEIQRLK